MTVDVDRHIVKVSGEEVKLTAKEFLLLQYLMQHRGRVLSRDLLLSDVWGYSYTGGTRTVDVHVRRLREKVPMLADAIVTVKQFGYSCSTRTGLICAHRRPVALALPPACWSRWRSSRRRRRRWRCSRGRVTPCFRSPSVTASAISRRRRRTTETTTWAASREHGQAVQELGKRVDSLDARPGAMEAILASMIEACWS